MAFRENKHNKILMGAFTLAAVLALSSSLKSAITDGYFYDENIHLEWNRKLVQTGTTERESNAFFNSKTPILLPNVFVFENTKKYISSLAALPASRLVGLVWYLLLLLNVFWLVRRCSTTETAWFAALLVALDPNLAAHSGMNNVDVIFTTCAIGSANQLFHYFQNRSLRTLLLAGIWLGLLFTSKFSAILFLPLLLILLLTEEVSLKHFFSLIGTTLLVVSSFYLFADWGASFGSLNLISTPGIFLQTKLPWLALPLPGDFLTGLDKIFHHNQTRFGAPNITLGGNLYHPGPSWYFSYLSVYKLPIAILVCGLLSLFYALRRGRGQWPKEVGYCCALATYTFATFSLFLEYQTGYRHVLVVLPFAFIVFALILGRLRTKQLRIIGAGVLVLSLFETLPYFGNNLAFTNSLIWPKSRAYQYFADSNLDWGQNDERIKKELGPRIHRELNPPHLQPGRNIISANLLAGVLHNWEQHRWLRTHLQPQRQIHFTHFEFEVTAENFMEFLKAERAIKPSLVVNPECLWSGKEMRLMGKRALCLAIASETVVVFSGIKGKTRLWSSRNRKEVFAATQAVYFWLTPGMYSFILEGKDSEFQLRQVLSTSLTSTKAPALKGVDFDRANSLSKVFPSSLESSLALR